MKSMPLCSSCLIDGVEVPATTVWTHQQDDPFPAGHTYRILVPIGHPLQPSSTLPIHTRLDRQHGGSWFFLLSAILPRDSEARFDYVLNTIDSVEQTESSLVISGIASPFVRDFSSKA